MIPNPNDWNTVTASCPHIRRKLGMDRLQFHGDNDCRIGRKPQFGKIFAAGFSRQIQLGVKLYF